MPTTSSKVRFEDAGGAEVSTTKDKGKAEKEADEEAPTNWKERKGPKKGANAEKGQAPTSANGSPVLSLRRTARVSAKKTVFDI